MLKHNTFFCHASLVWKIMFHSMLVDNVIRGQLLDSKAKSRGIALNLFRFSENVNQS